MRKKFNDCLKIGQEWESELEAWMTAHFATNKPGWHFISSKHVYRDKDGDQFPDYILVSNTGARHFLDAKKRHAYNHDGRRSFGFDKNYYTSYTNIAKKHNAKVFVAFVDKRFDPDHLYMLNMDQPPDFTWDYGNNGHGEGLCYRWLVSSLKKYKI